MNGKYFTKYFSIDWGISLLGGSIVIRKYRPVLVLGTSLRLVRDYLILLRGCDKFSFRTTRCFANRLEQTEDSCVGGVPGGRYSHVVLNVQ